MPPARLIRQLFRDQIVLGGTGALATEHALCRLSAARDDVTKQSNRFLVAGIALSAMYFVKVIGLRLDLVIFDVKIFEAPYGIALFAFAASASLTIALARFLDARVFDRQLRAACDAEWADRGSFAFETFPRTNAWLEPTSRVVKMLNESGARVTWLSLSLGLSGTALLVLYLLPLVCSIHFLIHLDTLANRPGVAVQAGGVALGLLSNLVLCVSSAIFVWIDRD